MDPYLYPDEPPRVNPAEAEHDRDRDRGLEQARSLTWFMGSMWLMLLIGFAVVCLIFNAMSRSYEGPPFGRPRIHAQDRAADVQVLSDPGAIWQKAFPSRAR